MIRQLLIAFAITIIVYFWMISSKVDTPEFYLFPVLGFSIFVGVQYKRYTAHSTELIMPLLCENVEGISYNGPQYPSLSQPEKDMLLPTGKYSGQGISISGKFGNQWFRQCNVILQKKSGKTHRTTFHGVVLQLPPLGIAPPLLVRPASQSRGALSSWIFGSNAPMSAEAPLGTLSDYGAELTLFAPDEATLAEFAPKLRALIARSDATFTDSATLDAILITQDATWIAIADGSLPFEIGDLMQSKAALGRNIERASAELAVPLRLMQLWSDALAQPQSGK